MLVVDAATIDGNKTIDGIDDEDDGIMIINTNALLNEIDLTSLRDLTDAKGQERICLPSQNKL